MKSFKHILFIALLAGIGLIGIAQTKPAQGPSASPSSAPTLQGDWEFTIAAPTGPLPVTGTIKQDGQTFSGTLKTTFGPAEIKSGKLEGNDFTLSLTVAGENRPFNATLTGKLDGDKVKGTVASPQGTFDVTGERKSSTAKASGGGGSSPMAAVVGDWVLTVSSPQGDLQVDLVLKQDGDKLVGTVNSALGGGEIKDGKLDGNKLALPANLDIQGTAVPITFNAVLDGTSMKGSIDSPQGSFDFTGKKKN
jgi:hypothetical protein